MADIIGRTGDTAHARNILQGNLPSTLPGNLMPETLRILNTLSQPCSELPPTTPIILDEEFINAYQVMPESTLSSPSGQHVGHYKAILDDHFLVFLHASMSTLPFQTGFIPDRWKKIVDIMLQKDPGSSRCHRLRIIAPFEVT